MSHSDDAATPQQRLEQVIADYLYAAELGVPVDRQELIAQHPDLAKHLKAFFAAQDQGKPAGTPTAGRDAATLRPAAMPGGTPSEAETLPPGQDGDTLPPPGKSTPRASSRAARPTSTSGSGKAPNFGDYQLLQEIARGGMGVVYKARQVSLNRIVALKMILTGQLASQDDVQRFYTEAQAAAHLDHAGIVPIYEVGQHKGHHYFSMGFVDGQSLAAKLAAGPLPPREAAELVLQVAEAIAYAHERGVIHRDLKPGNILLDKSGQPRVTDFGLAKRTTTAGEGSGVESLTATGQILGTPSYMPPEQAAGRIEEIGPLSDVYSLGAVLYTVLTGRPPFQSASTMDTLLAVLEEEPIAPRKLNSSVPLDLSTICLKCLEKEPHRRYASARHLAAELQRYLNGQPILARPITRVERGARWIARNPKKTGASCVALLVVLLVTWIVSGQMRAIREENARKLREAAEEHERQRLAAEEENDRRRAETFVEAVLTAPPDAVPYAVENLKPLSRHALPILRQRLGDQSRSKSHRLHAALALAALGEMDEAFFVDAIVNSAPAESRSILVVLASYRETIVPWLTARAARETKAETKVRLALSLLQLGDASVARELAQMSPEMRHDIPAFRTALIHQGVPTWFVSATRLRSILEEPEETADPALRYCLCLGIGLSPPERFSPDEKKELGEVLAKRYQDAADGATHSAAEWTLRQWQIDLPKLPPGKLAEKPADRKWFVNTQGMTLVQIPAGKAVKRLLQPKPGPQSVESVELPSFWLADREVTMEQWGKFLKDPKFAEEHPDKWMGEEAMRVAFGANPGGWPMHMVAWTDAVPYCNWLSRQEKLTPCYERKPIPMSNNAVWILKSEANGYRLPTDAEWVYACRAGGKGSFCYGNGESLLGDYAVYAANSKSRPSIVGSKLPQAWGLFDMHGNVWEWCQDLVPSESAAKLDPLLAEFVAYRTNCGGSWKDIGDHCLLETRVWRPPGYIGPDVGFRVALGQSR